MTMPSSSAPLLLAFFACAASVPAQQDAGTKPATKIESVIVHTRAGQFLEAERSPGEDAQERLWWGAGKQRREIPAGAVLEVFVRAELDAEYRKRAEALKDQPHARAALAKWCAEHGLWKELHRSLDPLLEDHAFDPAALAVLRSIALEHVVPKGRGDAEQIAWGLVLHGAQQLDLPTLRTMAALQLGKLPGAASALERARKSVRGEERAFALYALGLEAATKQVETGLAHAVLDADPRARQAAVQLVQHSGEADVIQPFLRALGSAHPKVQLHAAQALGALRDPRAIDALIEKLSFGPGPRSYILKVNQTSLISDYDVEVAQASFIADPVINVLQDGSALDVKVVGGGGQRVHGQVRGAVVDSLRRLTGAKLGADAAAWKAWRRDHPTPALSSLPRGE